MKLLITLKSFFGRELVRESLITSIILWGILQIPFALYMFNSELNSNVERNNLEKNVTEEILAKQFFSQSRFGDLVYTKKQIVEIGKRIGISDLVVCKDAYEEIGGKFNENKCPSMETDNKSFLKDFDKNIQIHFIWNKKNNEELVSKFIKNFMYTSVLALVISFFASVFIYNSFKRKIINLYESILVEEPLEKNLYLQFPELNFIIKIFFNLKDKILEHQNFYTKNKIDLEKAQIIKQVAHDIRSPLSALNMVASTLESVPEEKRLIIRNATQRINDIANNLLQQSKSGSNLNLESENSTTHQMANSHENIDQLKVSGSFEGISVVRNKASEPTMLVSVIDLIVSEKRTQYRNRMNLQIEAHLNQGYGLFSAVSNSDLARVLSNLINNSVEAIADRGSVVLNLQSKNDRAILTIQDDGVGIPDDILASLGKSVISHGKNQIDSGTGLGVLSATQFLQSIGGTIKYFSKLQQGTLVEITLPLCKSPAWFQEKIVFSSRSLLVTIDDDQTIHQIWSGRIKSAFSASTNIQHLVFSQLSTARDWISKMRTDDPDLFSRAIFLVDFEFVGSNENGLDFILSENIQDQSILVTSRFEEVSIRDKLISHNVKMIPKNLSPFVALSITT